MVTQRQLYGPAGMRWAIGASLLCAAIQTASGFEVECKAEVATTVTVSDALDAGRSRLELRQSLVEAAVGEGIGAVIGVQLQSRSASNVSATNGEIDDRFLSRMRAQSAGFGRPVVLDETLTSNGAETLLELKVDVTVCIPKNPTLVKRVVAIRSALNSQGEELLDFHTIIRNEMSSSDAFAVSAVGVDDFADLMIDARILDLGTTQRTIKGKRYNRISVTYAFSAEIAADGSLVTHTNQEFTNVLAKRDLTQAINDFMPAALSRGARAFHDKLLTAGADGKTVDASLKRAPNQAAAPFGIVDGKPTIAVYPPVGPGVKAIKRRRFDETEITRRIEEALRATGRFTLFERNTQLLTSSVEAEQDLAESGAFAANAADRGRLSNVKLIVQPFVAEFAFGPHFRAVEGLPGMYERTDYGKVSVTNKVLDTTTGEIKHQVTVPWGFTRESKDVQQGKVGGPGRGSWLRMAKQVGTRSAAEIVNRVFPIMVIKFSRGRVFLNRGKGGGIKVGDVLELFSVGEEMKDPQTGESLGGEEYSIGKIKVTKVAAKFSTARPLKRLEEGPKRGDIAR
jgi:hypothetical protein